MSDNKETDKKKPSETTKLNNIIAPSSSSMVALLIQRNVEKGEQLSLSTVKKKEIASSKK